MQRILRQTKLTLLLLVTISMAASTCHAEDLSGYWEGRWNSYSTAHNGPLQCTLVKIAETQYRADFSGRFFKIIPFRYSVVLHVEREGDTVALSGENYLGRRYGTFSYAAEADARSFVASYSSCRDCGEFVLTRCCTFKNGCP